jgi:hypothetical protein
MMKNFTILFSIITVICFSSFSVETHIYQDSDWLVRSIEQPVSIKTTETDLLVSNGLLERRFRMNPNLSTISYKNLDTNEEFIRGVKPEALIQINGQIYEVGGLTGQPNYAFLKEDWLTELQSDPKAFQFSHMIVDEITAHIPWKQKRYSADIPWPPKGKTVSLYFDPPKEATQTLEGLQLAVHYNIYQGMPAHSKWVTVQNVSKQTYRIDSLTTEMLAVVERESDVERTRTTKPRRTGEILEYNDLADTSYPRIHIQSDYSFCGMSYKSADQTTFWLPDDQYKTQVNYSRQWPHLLTSAYPYGPAVSLKPGESFESFRTYELLHDSDDKERRGLAIRRLQRLTAPWTTENPIMHHLRYSDSESIHNSADQCAEVGFEMIILSFGSGVNMESDNEEYIQKVKKDFDYAHSKGIEIGAYSLLSSRNAGPKYNVIDPKTGKPGAYFGNAPCLMSEWGDRYFKNLKNFMEQTGCDLLEHDGSYPGDPCASEEHNGHEGLADSQYKQHRRITNFYRWCRSKGIYLNVPDYYFLSGSNKTGMGYRETNWSLPRAMQLIHSRQNIFDGTWTKSPSQGWMFVPLVEYHGGGPAATIEPLDEHLDTYEAFLAQNFMAGVQACYRGPRIYDTEKTKQTVKKWVSFYKQYRDILDSDIIHLRRPDGRDYDGILHVNPELPIKGFAVFFNPLREDIERTIQLPLYYTGINKTAFVREQAGEGKVYQLDRNYAISLDVKIKANGWNWFTIE